MLSRSRFFFARYEGNGRLITTIQRAIYDNCGALPTWPLRGTQLSSNAAVLKATSRRSGDVTVSRPAYTKEYLWLPAVYEFLFFLLVFFLAKQQPHIRIQPGSYLFRTISASLVIGGVCNMAASTIVGEV